jgi:hypothetical protein
MAGLIQTGINAGEWPAGSDAELEARLVLATIHGLMAQWHLEPGSFSWEAAASAVAERSSE